MIVCSLLCLLNIVCCVRLDPQTSTWPHLNSDVGLEKGDRTVFVL